MPLVQFRYLVFRYRPTIDYSAVNVEVLDLDYRGGSEWMD